MPDPTPPRVALLLPGSPAYVEAVARLLDAGVVPIPLDPALPPAERDRVLGDLRPDVVVEDGPALRTLVAHHTDPQRPLSELLPRARAMHVTSGTTGRPKGVWSGLLPDEHARALIEEERGLWGFSRDDVHLVLSPLHHSAPLRFALGTLLAGGRVLVPGPFDAALVTRVIAEDRPSSTFCVPAHLQRLFAHWDAVGAPDLTSIRLLAHAGAACPPPLKERLLVAFEPGTTWEFYGSTEGQFTACRSEEWAVRRGTVGRARPGRTLSADPDGTLWCGVPPHARFEYWEAPEKTAAAWREGPEGPEFTVGDLGRVDPDGYVYLDGRREDLVISGGVNVYPAEVEGVLAAAPGVADIAVFGLPDDTWGHRVCAAYVGTADPAALTAYAREQLVPAKRPKEWHRLDALPRTPTGKVRRLDLPDVLGLTPQESPGRG
ncbi:class I adenylate-forming enzyme family protein [Nocardioides sp.]|uniref:class I adenylate-forming enzyme family protein n=1 Tax=Nocardioides sp. TaxID=35761 RepID=UPI00273700AD|nr:class I adenylate-forming enzyme family protein [Nocardioides sp.]MDP3890145.1 class I adenylate-forming enzyme family protein [Nocardioides sp.]